ncbi:MAG: hypothetical protein ACRCSN_14470 [Dermatophilaceae bacterium]
MTVRFITDEHIARALIAGLQRVSDDIDIVRVQDVGLRTMDDLAILHWQLTTIECSLPTTSGPFRSSPTDESRRACPCPESSSFQRRWPLGAVIDELALISGATDTREWSDRVLYLPTPLSLHVGGQRVGHPKNDGSSRSVNEPARHVVRFAGTDSAISQFDDHP